MAEQLALGFGGLLRQLRAEAGLTQEELAEAAGLSPRSVSDLERGINRTARKDTAVLLAGALGLAGPGGELFVAAARGKAPADEVLAAIRRTGPQPRGLAAGSPYRGLSVFDEQDAAFFFGREAAATALLDRMSRLLGGLGLLVVSGVSGAGKSSLLRAGVLPRIREAGLAAAPEAVSWPCLVFTPTRAPLDELALRVAVLAGADAAAVRRGLEAAPAWFALTARQAALARPPRPAGNLDGPAAGRDQPSRRQQRLLLVVDQFEELFTQCADEGQRRAFITALHAAGSAGHGPDHTPAALVMVAVRADFEARCADYAQLAGSVQDRYLVTSMTERQLRMAITEPAKKAGSKVDDELTALLLAEVSSGQPGAFGAGVLPLLSHALDQAWRCRTGDAVTLADYERAGGIEGAVAGSAQRAYDQLTPAQQAAARQVFLRLTATSSDGVDTAARATRAELTDSTSAQAQDVEAVLEAFAAERLLTLAAGTVEISHEALLTAWPLLRDTWLADTHADRIVRTRLHNTAAEWDRHSRDPSYLYSGSLLQAAAGTAARIGSDPGRHPPLSQTERDFLHASDQGHRRRARRRQALIALLAVLVIGFASAAVVAIRAGQQATRQLHVVSSGLLINESRDFGDYDPDLSKLLAVAAWRINPSSAARSAMLAAAARPGLAILRGYTDTVLSVAFSPDGKILASGDNDYTVLLWDMATRQQIGLPLNNTGAVNWVAFSPDSKTLATGDADGTVRLWNTAIPLPTSSRLANGQASVNRVAFSPDGKTLATGDADGTVRLWNVATRRPIGGSFTADAGLVNLMAFSPDGKTLATGDVDGKVRLWDMATHRQLQLRNPRVSQAGPVVVAFSPDGKTLAAGGADDKVQLWDLATRQPTGLPLITGGGGVYAVAFSPDSKTLATGGADGTVRLWEVTTGQPIGSSFTRHGGQVTSVAFSPDGKTLASSSYDATVRLWNVATPSQNLAKATNLVSYLCALAGRSLTLAEWAQYVPILAYQNVCP